MLRLKILSMLINDDEMTILSMLMNDAEIERIGRDQKESHQLCKYQWQNHHLGQRMMMIMIDDKVIHDAQ